MATDNKAAVSVVRCPDYERGRVFAAVKRSIDLVGGISKFVKPGTRVLIKPNLLSPRPPEDGVDTNPEVVRALVKLVKDLGAVPLIGDSPGGYGNNIGEIFKVSGMKAVADEEGAELVKFNSSKFIDGIPITRHLFDCDSFISVPKLKTHCITVLTAALKNTFGTVTGLYKAECHSRAPKEEDFAKIIARIHSIAKPRLTVVDGVVAMEGDGPSSGALRKLNLIMAGEDAVAIDSCIARIIGLSPLDILVTKEAYEMGLGEADLSRIEILGDSIEDFILKDFKLPQTTPLKILPKTILNSIAALVKFKPVIERDLCRKCNLCRVSCPVDAIMADKDFCRINYQTCVRCLCCHEVCPYRAVSIKRNILTKLIWG